MNQRRPRRLEHEHHPEAISRRLAKGGRPQYVSDAVLGGIDGCVTTFAVVSGTLGAGFPPVVALVLGLANLLADGFSMAVSNYQAARAAEEHREALRHQEARHIREVPEGEREEIRQIFAAKGFSGEVLEQVVDVITSDEDRWIETMLAEEHGLSEATVNPYRAAATTFAAFFAVGLVPLLPFLLTSLEVMQRFALSAVLAGVMFFAVGVARSMAFDRPVLRSAFSTLLTGGAAAALAYVTGLLLRELFGISF